MKPTTVQPEKTFGTSKTLLITTVLVYVAGLIRLPGPTGFGITVVWVTAMGAGFLFRSQICIPGAMLGDGLALLSRWQPQGLQMTVIQFFLFIAVSVLAIGWATWLSLQPVNLRSRHFIAILLASIGPAAYLMMQMETLRVGLVYFGAVVIVTILTLTKYRTLKKILPTLYVSWLSGYLIQTAGIFFLDLDPSGYLNVHEFLSEYLLIPYAAYLLQILICAHVIAAIQPDPVPPASDRNI